MNLTEALNLINRESDKQASKFYNSKLKIESTVNVNISKYLSYDEIIEFVEQNQNHLDDSTKINSLFLDLVIEKTRKVLEIELLENIKIQLV